MKTKFFIAGLLFAGVSLIASAQGYKDGIEYYKVDQFDNAKELLERNLNAPGTDKSETYYYLGMIAFKQGDLNGAASYFEKGVSADATNPHNYVGQGMLALKQGGNAKALFEQARKLTKKDPKLEIAIARAYYAVNPTTYAKDIEKCVKTAQKWNIKDPDSHIFLGDMDADKKIWGDAAGKYEMAFDFDPNNVEAYVKYANTYFNVAPAMAIERLEELNTKSPNKALVQRQLAEKYYSDFQGAKSAEKYGEYIKNPNHFAQDEVRYVQLLFFGEKYQQSYELATNLISKLDPNDSKVFYMRRMQLYNLIQLETWQEAAEAGKAFFSMTKPTDAEYEVKDYTDYGRALQETGQNEAALEAYNKAIELNPQNTDLIRNMGDTYAATENYEKAASYYQRLVDTNQNTSNDLFVLSRYYYYLASDAQDADVRADATAKAQKYLDEVDALVPNNVQIVNQKANMAKFLEGDENNGKAVAAYQQLLKILDTKADKNAYARYYKFAYNYLAGYEFSHGDKALAKEYYKKWLEFDPENEALRKYVETLK
ncbi:MAG: tetratricopeptide repeat protein [Muribaculaceae bacterium]|nr:tetratricopeptide repeat protein [Muribaculaceae bacterium]